MATLLCLFMGWVQKEVALPGITWVERLYGLTAISGIAEGVDL